MSFLLLFLQELNGWEKYIGETATILLIFIILVFIYRMAPTWKELKLRESDVREKETESAVILANSVTHLADAQTTLATTMKEIRFREAEVNGKLAESVGKLADAQINFTEVVQSISIEQRKATDNLLLLQRVNLKESENMTQSIEYLNERIDQVEKQFKEQ